MPKWTVVASLVIIVLTLVGVVVMKSQEPRVSKGVTLMDRDVGGLKEGELLVYLYELSSAMDRYPIDPVIDTRTGGIIPGLAGIRVDANASMQAAFEARPNTVVELVVEALPPANIPHGSVIFQGNPLKQQMALVVNVAWGNEVLEELLSVFAEHDVKGTFFLVGRWVNAFPDLARTIAVAGHEFGNHAYSDYHMRTISSALVAEEITRTTEAIKRALGDVPVKFFSPPYNEYNQTVLDIASDLGYVTVLCSLDTADWLRPGVERIVRRILPNSHNGGIVLMHPTEQTPAALREIIPGLLEQGYELVTLSELLGLSHQPPATSRQ